ncbi:hypothetical protein J7K74_03720, partial [Candidatus Woesearchaeota archaeon]|nr:hypothetical protein [Candidatus Woesearchaeota archaeon]
MTILDQLQRLVDNFIKLPDRFKEIYTIFAGNIAGPLSSVINQLNSNIIFQLASSSGLIANVIGNNILAIGRELSSPLNMLNNIIIQGLTGVQREIMRGLPNLGGQILGGLSGISHIIGSLNNIISHTLPASLGNLGGQILGGLSNLNNIIRNNLNQLISSVTQGLPGLGGQILSGINSLGQILQSPLLFLANIASQLGPQALLLLNNIQAAITGGLAPLPNAILALPQELMSAGQEFANWFLSQLFSFWNTLMQQIENIIPFIGEASANALRRLEDFLGYWGYTMLNIAVLEPLESVYKKMLGAGGTPGWLEDIFERIKVFGKWLVDAVRGIMEYEPPQTYEKAFDAMYKFVSMNLMQGIISSIALFIDRILWSVLRTHILGTGLGGGGGGKGGEIYNLIQSIWWALGVGWLSWVALGPLVSRTIGDPLREYYAIKYRPERLSVSKIQKYYAWRWIDEEAARSELARLGYDDARINLLLREAWETLSKSDIEDLYEEGIITQEDVYNYFLSRGYTERDAALLTLLTHIRAIKSERSMIISRLAKFYARGLLRREDAERYLQALGVPGFQAQLILEAWELDYQLRIIDEHLDNLQDQYVKGLITFEDLEREASKYILRGEALERFLEEAQIRKAPHISPLTYYKLETKLSRLETQKHNLESEIKYYQERLAERERYWSARMEVVKARYQKQILSIQEDCKKQEEKIRKEYEFRLEVAKYVLENYVLLPPEEIDNLIREYEREKMVAPKERAKQLEIIIRYLKAIKDLPPDGRRA